MDNLFIKRPTSTVRFFVLFLLSIVLMVLDHHEHKLAPVKKILAQAVHPLQSIVDGPLHMMHWITFNINSHEQLTQQNRRLQSTLTLTQAKLQQFEALARENKELRALLKFQTKTNQRISTAQLLSVASNPYRREVILDRGANAHISKGQPVLDAYGLMGQIIDVKPSTSTVLLLSDPRSAIPVQISRNGQRAIVVGTNRLDQLKMIHIPITASVKVGDVLVTSGLGGRFPFGFSVGVVTQVSKQPGQHFLNILITPSAHLNRSRIVLLMWDKS